MAIGIQLSVDGGSGAATRSTGGGFGAPELARLMAAVDHALLANGNGSPTNVQRVDYLWARVRTELMNFVRADEQSAAASAVSNLPI